jgi:hypothetical protein
MHDLNTTSRSLQPTALTQPNKVGLVFAAIIGGWHLLWALLVFGQAAQPLLNFIFWAHMIQPIYIIAPFNPVAAITLLIITSVAGYLFGYIGALIWNKLHTA